MPAVQGRAVEEVFHHRVDEAMPHGVLVYRLTVLAEGAAGTATQFALSAGHIVLTSVAAERKELELHRHEQ